MSTEFTPLGDAVCPFCQVAVDRIAFVETDVVGLWDAFPVTEGHLLLTSRRHVASWSELTADEQRAMFAAIGRGYALLGERFAPDGVNVGWNDAFAMAAQSGRADDIAGELKLLRSSNFAAPPSPP